MQALALWVHGKQAVTEQHIRQQLEWDQNIHLDDYDDVALLDEDDEVVVDGVMLQDCGEMGLVERWCVVTKEAFLICARKDANPSLTIPLTLISSAQHVPTTNASFAASFEKTSKDLKTGLTQESERQQRSPGVHTPGKDKFPRFGDPDDDNGEEDLGLDMSKGSIAITTRGTMFHKPHEYKFLTPNADLRDWWLHGFRSAMEYQRRQPELSKVEMVRRSIYMWYQGDPFQITVAICIFFNFISQAAEAQIQPTAGSKAEHVFEVIELIFLAIFCTELAINMLATLWWPFFRSGWNWFDMIVIGTSLWSTIGDVGGGTGVLRLLRAGRVIRFFTRLPSLRKIIVALYESIPAMLNAMLLTGVVLAMYGVMGVSFFSFDERFKTFEVAIFTLFQASTGDGWSDIVRGLYTSESRYVNVGVSFYFISFMLIVALILMQVVIAVLLEEFSKVSDAENAREVDSVGQRFSLRPSPFEAFFDELKMSRDLQSQRDKILQLWKRLADSQNLSEDGRMGFDEVSKGLKQLRTRPPCLMTVTDWKEMVVEPGFCDADYMIDREAFVEVVRAACRADLYLELTKCLSITFWDEGSINAVLHSLRCILEDYENLKQTKHDSGDQGTQHKILEELRAIGTRVSGLETQLSLSHAEILKLNRTQESQSNLLNQIKTGGAGLIAQPNLAKVYDTGTTSGATLSKELPSSAHELSASGESPVERATSSSGLTRYLQMQVTRKDEELQEKLDEFARKEAEFEKKEADTLAHFTALLQQRDTELSKLRKASDVLENLVAAKEAKEASSTALQKEEMNAFKRELLAELDNVKKQQQGMSQQQQHQVSQQLREPKADVALESTGSDVIKPQLLETNGMQTTEPPRMNQKVLLAPVSPRGMPATLIPGRGDGGVMGRNSQSDQKFDLLVSGDGDSLHAARFDSRQVRRQSAAQQEHAHRLSEDLIERKRESEDVRHRLRELLDLKREINQFERSRSPPGEQREPYTVMSARSPSSHTQGASAPSRYSYNGTQASNDKRVSITSPMQLPPDFESRHDQNSMPPSPPQVNDPNIHSSFLRILGMKAGDGRLSPSSPSAQRISVGSDDQPKHFRSLGQS